MFSLFLGSTTNRDETFQTSLLILTKKTKSKKLPDSLLRPLLGPKHFPPFLKTFHQESDDEEIFRSVEIYRVKVLNDDTFLSKTSNLKGCFPDKSVNRITPRDQQSDLRLYEPPVSTDQII